MKNVNSIINLKERSLAWGERVLKTDVRYLIKGGSWLGGGQVITTLAAFVLSLLFANLLSPETYGIYKYILSIGTLLTIPTLSGIDAAVSRAVAQGKEASVFQGLKAKIKWGLLGSIVSTGISIYYYLNGNSIFAISILAAGICIPFIEAFDIYNSLLNGRKMFREFTYYNVGTQVILTILLGAFIYLNKNIVLIIVFYFFLNVALNLFYLLLAIKLVKPNKETDPEVVSYGMHLSLIDVIGTVLGQLDKILIFHYLGAAELALYSIAIAAPEQIKGMLKNVQFLALPKFAERSKEEGKTTIYRKTFQFEIFISLIIIIFIILAPYFFKIFFPRYILAVPYSQVLAFSILGATPAVFLYTFLESHAAKKQLYQYNIYSNIINLFLLFPLIYYFGLWGAVWTRVITRFFLFGLSMYLVKKA